MITPLYTIRHFFFFFRRQHAIRCADDGVFADAMPLISLRHRLLDITRRCL